MNEKIDRRKKYTRMVLKDSFIMLLKSKPLSSITVKEICNHADVNRSTFYAHYTDPYDLLMKIEAEIIADMNIYLSQQNFAETERALQTTEKLLEYIVSKYDVCQTLLNESENTSFEQRVMDVARKFLINNWMDENKITAVDSAYISTFIISGSIHVIKHWLANNMDKTPQQIAQIINHIANNGIRGIEIG
ncbi:TetR-like C-terminal domain-containing protein [Clostridium sp. 1xD42-85]|uniref:TetR/AcrR family transcriptional regulator n=2 Tax=Clostridia TaxID=186801 RepID=UPI000EA0D6D3|nr:TetR-like C-terminal domain-containing protein [Clostridium sp. 1xD42-85]NBJ70290.1 TetR/AcrR family transcriptional regulator [Roseburia sp. 1XD42-34]RKI76429.1 TetR/AcrR family transcriptional regulator [Clostridium sp. 1xD42-85]